jgi:putative sigma-54 modulation protein
MRIAFTFRNLDSSESLKSYATEKLEKLQKYLHAPLDAEVILSLERHLHCIDVTLQCEGQLYIGREESEDMYASIDMVMDKVRRQVQRVKGVLTQQRKRSSPGLAAVAAKVK